MKKKKRLNHTFYTFNSNEKVFNLKCMYRTEYNIQGITFGHIYTTDRSHPDKRKIVTQSQLFSR